MISYGSMSSDVSSIRLSTEPSFFWFLLRLASMEAASKRSIPGHMTPLSLLASGVTGVGVLGMATASELVSSGSMKSGLALLIRVVRLFLREF